jgi:hypothetical protein
MDFVQKNLICCLTFLYCALIYNEFSNEEYEKHLKFGSKYNRHTYKANDHIPIGKENFSDTSVVTNL